MICDEWNVKRDVVCSTPTRILVNFTELHASSSMPSPYVITITV